MSDQNGGKTEATGPESGPSDTLETSASAISRQNRTPPVIEGEAEDITPPRHPEAPASEDATPSAELEADPEPNAEPKAEAEPASPMKPAATAPADEPARTGGALLPIAVLIGAVALGGGGYYLWNVTAAPPPKLAATAVPEKIAAPPEKPQVITADQAAPADKAAPVAPPPKEADVAPARPASENPPPEAKPAANAEADKTLAAMAARLAETQAAVERLALRVQTVESQLEAPKNDSRAALSTRESGPADSGAAAARLVVAQSLLTALRQGDDYTVQLAALQNFGADPARLAQLRAGLAAPTLGKLAAAFATLAPKLAAAASPAKPVEAPPPAQNTRDAVLGFIKTEAGKLVRIRPAGAPDKDAAAIQIERIGDDLRAGDLVAALAARQQLPAPALALSADWATAAQMRLDAEAAARAELAEALQSLTRAKS
jgi:hypothetical protein